MHFSVVRSSVERGWRGFDATLYDTTSGVDETRFTKHTVGMHVGAPVLSSVRCGGETVRKLVRAGDVTIVPAGHVRIRETGAPARHLAIRVDPEFVDAAARSLGVSDAFAIVPQLDVRDERIECVARAICCELLSDEAGDPLFAESLGAALAAHLVRRFARGFARGPAVLLSDGRMRRVLAYIDANCTSDVPLAELARIAGVTPSHFAALFKRSVGSTPHGYVVRKRIAVAMRLLEHSELSIGMVALEAGFANQAHLTTWMRRLAGTTPGVYRREEIVQTCARP